MDHCKHGFPLSWHCGFCRDQGEMNEEKESKEESQSTMSRDGSS